MRFKSFLEKTFLGETCLEKINSPINGEITVYDGWFGKNMRIGGVTQSGWLVEKLWRIAIRQIFNFQFSISKQFPNSNFKCLILGLGAGDAARLISKKWPEAEITGIEIDPKVAEIGKKHFEIEKIKNLEIVIGDAIQEIKNQTIVPSSSRGKSKIKTKTENSKFDLILIDMYVGKNYPKEAESEEFLKGVKNLLDSDGVAIFNRLSYGDFEKPANEFSQKLRRYFPDVQVKKAITNLLIFCQRDIIKSTNILSYVLRRKNGKSSRDFHCSRKTISGSFR